MMRSTIMQRLARSVQVPAPLARKNMTSQRMFTSSPRQHSYTNYHHHSPRDISESVMRSTLLHDFTIGLAATAFFGVWIYTTLVEGNEVSEAQLRRYYEFREKTKVEETKMDADRKRYEAQEAAHKAIRAVNDLWTALHKDDKRGTMAAVGVLGQAFDQGGNWATIKAMNELDEAIKLGNKHCIIVAVENLMAALLGEKPTSKK